MTPAEFARLAASTRLRPPQVQMAQRVLVDGWTSADAGREAGKSRAEASRAAARIRAEALREHAECPTCGRIL